MIFFTRQWEGKAIFYENSFRYYFRKHSLPYHRFSNATLKTIRYDGIDFLLLTLFSRQSIFGSKVELGFYETEDLDPLLQFLGDKNIEILRD